MRSLLVVGGAFSILLAIFVPYFKVPLVGVPFHPSLLVLFIILLAYLSVAGVRLVSVLLVIGLLLLSSISAFYASMVGLDFRVGAWLYKLAPIFSFYISFFICYRSELSGPSLRKFFLASSVIFVLLSVGQFIPEFKDIYISAGYITQDRSSVWDRYYMLLAPMANPNNSAAVAAALVIGIVTSWSYISGGRWIIKTAFFLFVPFLILLMLMGYARTVSAALVLALGFWVIFKGGVALRIFSGLAVIFGIVVFLSYDTRQLYYYATIFSALSDNSFTSRFDYWWNVVDLLNEYPASWIFGMARVQDALVQVSGNSIIDSSYLFILSQYGAIVLLGFFAFALIVSSKSFRAFVFLIYLGTCGVTLAVFSDVRLTIIFGGILGYLYSLPPSLPKR